MKLKIVTVLGLVILFTIIISVQYTGTAEAHYNSINYPLTSPVTAPLTSPITFFSISGKVTSQIIGRFIKILPRFALVANVTVTAKNIFSGATFTAQTDDNGNYTISDIDEKGTYFVRVLGGKKSLIVPPLAAVTLNHQKNIKNINFQELLFK